MGNFNLHIAYFYGNIFWFNVGVGIFLSDFVHHFVVLNYFVGDPEFHLLYRNSDLYKMKKKLEKNTKKFLRRLIEFD